MRHLRRELRAIADDAVDACQGFDGVPVVDRQSEIEEALSAWRPSLMFYGLYNAGKSTLVNALLSEDGEKVAATADRPCTTGVETYEQGDYIIYDTPGLDAPQDHDDISKRQLEKSHVIVFVVSTEGSFDERATVRELARIWESGQPLIVVLNDKSGDDRRSPQIAGKREQLLGHLEEVTGDRSVREDIDFILVNAATGERARQQMADAANDNQRECAEVLYEHSGVEELAEVMMARLLESKGRQVLVPAQRMLQNALGETIDELDEQRGGDGTAKFFRSMQQTLMGLERDFIEFSGVAIEALRNTLKEDLAAGMRAETPLESFVEDYAEDVGALIQEQAEKTLRRAQQELTILEEASQPGTEFDVDFGFEDGGVEHDSDFGRHASVFSQLSSRQRKTIINRATKYLNSPEGQELLQSALLTLRDLSVPGIKGRWKHTLSRWAGKLGKGLGVGLQVIAVVYELRQAQKAQREYEEKMSQQQRDIENTAAKMARQAETEVRSELPDAAEELLAPFRDFIADLQDQFRDERDRTQRCIAELESLVDRLTDLHIDIPAA